MIIRQATSKEMRTLWYKKYTTEFFEHHLKAGSAAFFTVEKNKMLIAELYVFYTLDDSDFANGTTRAYLCAFRVDKTYRGQGIGSMLMREVFDHLREKGIHECTIGVESRETQNVSLYKALGFQQVIKTVTYDPCDVDKDFKAKPCAPYDLRLNLLK